MKLIAGLLTLLLFIYHCQRPEKRTHNIDDLNRTGWYDQKQCLKSNATPKYLWQIVFTGQ